MTQPVDILAPAIGACLNCRSLFLVTFDTPNCILCGNPPTYTLPLTSAYPEPVEEPEQQPAPAEEPAPPAQDEVAGDVSELCSHIADYLVGEPVGPDELNDHFQSMGVDPEVAATAVGRLQAVRELLQALESAGEPAPVAPDEPLSPLAQSVQADPSVSSPPAQGEQDRTNSGASYLPE